MNSEKITSTIEDIESDITYFSKMEFTVLKQKFERDLHLIQYLKKQLEEVTKNTEEQEVTTQDES